MMALSPTTMTLRTILNHRPNPDFHEAIMEAIRAEFDGGVIETSVEHFCEGLLDRRIAIEYVVRSMDGLSAEERRATRHNALFGPEAVPDSPNTRWHDEPTWPDGVELGHGATIAELVDDQGEPTW